MGFSKSVIGPIIATIFIMIQAFTGIEFPENVIGQVTEFVTYGTSLALLLYGIIKNHKKEKDPD